MKTLKKIYCIILITKFESYVYYTKLINLSNNICINVFQQCIFLDFHIDDDNNNLFPFNSPINDPDKRNKAKFKILQYIYKYQTYPSKKTNIDYKETNELNFDFDNISKEIINKSLNQYRLQTPQIYERIKGEINLHKIMA